MATLEDRRREEFRRALARDRPLIEPNDAERSNGWTAEALTAYVAEQEAAQSLRMDQRSMMRKTRPVRANSKYSKFRWRR